MNDFEKTNVREAVGLFQSERDLQAAIDDLLTHGFDRSELSLLAPVTAVEEKLGNSFRSVAQLEDNPAVPTTAYVPTETIGDAQGAIIGSLMYVGAFIGLVPIIASGGSLAAINIAFDFLLRWKDFSVSVIFAVANPCIILSIIHACFGPRHRFKVLILNDIMDMNICSRMSR